MHIYLNNFFIAIIVFSFILLLSVLPFVIYYYKKYGHFGGVRGVAIYLFIFSILTAYFMVIFPLPEVGENFCANRQANKIPNFELFRFIKEIGEELKGHISLISVLKSKTFMVTAFNVLLLLPMGFFLRYLFDLRWWKVLLIGFLTSLFFEITQLTGNFGFYDCPYRLFEVDDLMTNTVGVMLGYWLFRYFKFLPSTKIKKIDFQKDANLTQRFLMLTIDYLFITYIAENLIIPDKVDIIWHLLWLLIIFFMYYIIVPFTKIKTTLAGKIFGIRFIKNDNNPPDIKSLTIFYGLLIFVPTIISELTKYFVMTKIPNGIYSMSGFALLFIWFVLIFGFVLLRKDKKGIHNILSKLKLVNK